MPVIVQAPGGPLGQRARYETLSADYVHRLLYKGCLQRNRKSYTSLTPDLFLVTGFLPDGDASVYPALIFSFINLYAPNL
ncbi:hypothetical protein A9Y87_03435 [Salmonella enterica subsp. enterica]|nr:hypothetical protein A9Y87_03435 [Salmonella enterica subsp. enterica]